MDMNEYSVRRAALIDEIDDLQWRLKELEAGNLMQKSKLEQQIYEIKSSLDERKRCILQHQNAAAIRKRIDELESDRKRLAQELEATDRHIYLCELFIKRKAELLEQSINSRFKLASFKLFETQINGGINEICEITYKGIPYSSLNNAAKINTGIDIINALNEYYRFDAPIFVDNAESVTELHPGRAQMIRLIVSERDRELRIERTEVSLSCLKEEGAA